MDFRWCYTITSNCRLALAADGRAIVAVLAMTAVGPDEDIAPAYTFTAVDHSGGTLGSVTLKGDLSSESDWRTALEEAVRQLDAQLSTPPA